jgi:hypothetical protein
MGLKDSLVLPGGYNLVRRIDAGLMS